MSFEKLKGEIVSVATVAGEMVGRLVEIGDHTLTLSSPCTVIPSQDNGSGGLHPAVCLTGNVPVNEADVFYSGIVTVVKTNSDVERVWQKATSGIIL